MNLKKLLGWAVVIFIAYYVLTDPTAAGGTAHHLINDLKGAGNSLASFFNSVQS